MPAVPFNTTYKGREITSILRDSAATAIVCLSNYDCPDLQHVIVTGRRTLLFLEPVARVNVQMVFEKAQFSSDDEAFYAVGELLVETPGIHPRPGQATRRARPPAPMARSSGQTPRQCRR